MMLTESSVETKKTPPAPWQDVPMEKWQDWRWQMANRLNSLESFAEIINLTPEEIEGLSEMDLFRVDITPYFASLIDPDDPHCPIRMQVIPTGKELVPFESGMIDHLGEEKMSPVPGLVHRYPDRVLMLVTTQCASYCRFCTRSRIVGDPHEMFNQADYEKQIEYIASHPQVRDVLISGGDPLTLPVKILEKVLRGLREIPHVEVIRIGTRVPIFLPQRITDEITDMLKQFHPLWMNLHINHPKEITPEVELALARLADAGIPLGCQTVLMAGINDCQHIMKALMHKLVMNRVRPYYLFMADQVQGAGHFRTPVAKGVEIIEALRGHTSGFAVPVFSIDAPEGGGKVTLSPNYVISFSTRSVVIRNYEGYISAYKQPETYTEHDPSTCAYCQRQAYPDGDKNVAALLAGKGKTIIPEDWHDLHERR